MFEGLAHGGAAGAEQRHLVRLQVAEGAGHGLFGGQLAGLAGAQQGVERIVAVGAVLERVVASALHGGQGQAQFVLQLGACAQALLQAAHALA